MSQHHADHQTPEAILEAAEQAAQTLDRHIRARASGEIPPDTPISLVVPAVLVPPPYEEAVAQIELSLRSAISKFGEFNDLLAEVFSLSLTSQLAAAVEPAPKVAGKGLDDRLEQFCGDLNRLLDHFHGRLSHILKTRGIHQHYRHLDYRGRRLLKETFAEQRQRNRLLSLGPDNLWTPEPEGGEA